MRLTMKERKTMTKAVATRYRRAKKKEKGQILNDFVADTGYNRAYAARLLRSHGKRLHFRPGVLFEGRVDAESRGKRAVEYGPEVQAALLSVWRTMDYLCGKRLAAILPEVVPRLVHFGELHASAAVCKKLMRVSAATIDRLLAPERKKMALKNRSRTKPGTLLKHQIPVRTFSQWDDSAPGFLEVDLVGHEGGTAHGDYCQTLDATDVATGWTEPMAVLNKAQCWVFEAIQAMRGRLPFALRGLDSDNGSEFINHQLFRYCEQERITFTRSRAGRKNDNCYVEQKNWSIVRRFAGYGRFEGKEACAALNRLYAVVRDYVNFFMPSVKLVEKVRDGASVHRRYDEARTPYRRVLESQEISAAVKKTLQSHYETLNPAALSREIRRLQEDLQRQCRRPVSYELTVSGSKDRVISPGRQQEARIQ